jgi:hypothetical protein
MGSREQGSKSRVGSGLSGEWKAGSREQGVESGEYGAERRKESREWSVDRESRGQGAEGGARKLMGVNLKVNWTLNFNFKQGCFVMIALHAHPQTHLELKT